MYNRILKRPMFKRGGPSYQAQGTGITSPFDTPRRQYNTGTSWEEIQENIRKSTADNTTTMQDVAQGFSYLGNPYKEDGSAKTVGEMIWEGSQAVSGARGERKKTAQAGELAAQEVGVEKLKSDLAISEAEKDRATKLSIAKMESQELKRMPLERLITTIAESPDLKNAVPGSFPSVFGTQIARGRAIQWRLSADGITVGVLEPHLWQNLGTSKEPKYDYNADGLSSKIPWWDPVKSKWHVFNDDGTGNATGDPVKSFLTVEEAVAYLKGGNLDIIPDNKSLENENENETASTVSLEINEDIVHPTNDGTATGEISDEYVLEYAKKNKIVFDLQEYKEKGGSSAGYSYTTKTFLKNKLKNENAPSIFKDTDTKKEKRNKDAAFSWFERNYEKGNKIMPERHKQYLDEWLEIKETLTAQKTDTKKMATGGMAEQDASVSELDELNNWWRNQLATNWNE